MSEKYKFKDPEGMYFVTMTTVGWVDLFTRKELKQVIIDSLRHCQKEKGLVIHAWCLMPQAILSLVQKKEFKAVLSLQLRTFLYDTYPNSIFVPWQKVATKSETKKAYIL